MTNPKPEFPTFFRYCVKNWNEILIISAAVSSFPFLISFVCNLGSAKTGIAPFLLTVLGCAAMSVAIGSAVTFGIIAVLWQGHLQAIRQRHERLEQLQTRTRGFQNGISEQLEFPRKPREQLTFSQRMNQYFESKNNQPIDSQEVTSSQTYWEHPDLELSWSFPRPSQYFRMVLNRIQKLLR